jgi:hypothetical protein
VTIAGLDGKTGVGSDGPEQELVFLREGDLAPLFAQGQQTEHIPVGAEQGNEHAVTAVSEPVTVAFGQASERRPLGFQIDDEGLRRPRNENGKS